MTSQRKEANQEHINGKGLHIMRGRNYKAEHAVCLSIVTQKGLRSSNPIVLRNIQKSNRIAAKNAKSTRPSNQGSNHNI